jgi:hypothetical protein
MDLHQYGMEVALDSAMDFQGQDVILKKNDETWELRATPVTFNPKMTDQKIVLLGQKQSFLFRASTFPIEVIPGLLILWNGFQWEVIRGQGHFYYNDPYQLGMVVQCLQGKPIF